MHANATSNANELLDEGIELYDAQRFENAADVLSELINDRAFRRLDGLERELALRYLTYSLSNQDKTKESIKYTKKLLVNSKNEYGKHSENYVDVLLLIAKLQYRLGKERDAIKTVQEMESILERLGDGYHQELADTRGMASQIRKKEWNNERLPKDLSEFYTLCESIENGDKIPSTARLMNDYVLIGKDFKPPHKLSYVFKTTYVKQARENSTDRKNRLIFVPDIKHLDDWCVVYPDGTLVDRAFSVPPKD